tara:strand:+ start:273 stop:731 length:459 start_codon:yes stop_codon:yes gene_type:complete
MSLIKAYDLKLEKRRTFELIKADFITAVKGCMMLRSNIKREDLSFLIKYYAEYSCHYLKKVANTLEEPKGVSSTMKFMNSYIATFVTEAGFHYYNKEQGFSIIDKAVQAALDTNGVVSEEQIDDFITEIEDSYVEVEVDYDEEEIPLSVDET